MVGKNLFVMGIVTNEEVCKRLKVLIKSNYKNLSWVGIKLEIVSSIDNVNVNIDDDSFYAGNGDYYFGGFVSFMVNTVFDENNIPIGDSLKNYTISPRCKISIYENSNDFEIKIIEPIYVVSQY